MSWAKELHEISTILSNCRLRGFRHWPLYHQSLRSDFFCPSKGHLCLGALSHVWLDLDWIVRWETTPKPTPSSWKVTFSKVAIVSLWPSVIHSSSYLLYAVTFSYHCVLFGVFLSETIPSTVSISAVCLGLEKAGLGMQAGGTSCSAGLVLWVSVCQDVLEIPRSL